MENKLSFKTTKATGKWRSFQNDYTEIKSDEKAVGRILYPSIGAMGNSDSFRILLHVVDGNKFKNITLIAKFETLDATKEFR